MQLCNFANNALSQKTMFKVSNRNPRKRCLLISKITLERRHLTTSYLPEVTVQNHVLDHGNIIYVLLYFHAWTVFPRIYTNLQSGQTICNFSNSRPIYVTLWEMRNHYRNTWFMKISKCRHFLFLKKQPQKWTKFSTFYLIFKGSSFQYHKVRHLNFL